MKSSKLMPQSRMQKIVRWLPLPLVLCAIAVQSGLISYRESLLSPVGPTLLYLPGLDNTKGLSLLTLVNLVSIGLFLLYICFYVRKRQKDVAEKFVFLSSSFAFLIGMFTPVIGVQIKHLDTLATDQHIYHLFSQEKLFPHGLYTVLECDSLGLMCHAYGTPDKTSLLTPGTCFMDYAQLEQNSVTHELMLSIEKNTYQLDPAGDTYVYQQCMTAMSR
jgi:hypothetical protein